MYLVHLHTNVGISTEPKSPSKNIARILLCFSLVFPPINLERWKPTKIIYLADLETACFNLLERCVGKEKTTQNEEGVNCYKSIHHDHVCEPEQVKIWL